MPSAVDQLLPVEHGWAGLTSRVILSSNLSFMQSFEYFISNKNYFWTLEEDGEVIAIRNGDTIAYSEFAIQLLEDIADQGLPPFGSLLLVIIATNYPTNDSIGQIEKFIHQNSHWRGFNWPEDRLDVLRESIRFLRLLASLPAKYTSGNTRVQLFQLLFADCHKILSKKVSRQIISGIKQLKDTGNQKVLRTLSGEGEFSDGYIYDEFRCIALLLKKFPDTNALIGKLAGVPEIQEPVLEEEEERAVPGDFIESLIDNPTTFPVGALIKSLWSGMSIPIHHSLPSAQPMGGFSDLSNKGDLDKLLISEFAGDDWLFLSRLANNEALYLHRETPPGADQLERIILVDVSIKSWGTPKVLAYAILLAIIKHPKTDIHCTAYAVGNNFYPITVDTVDAVIQSIQLVDGALHPAAGLIKFFELSPARKTEVFFIASADTMRHPAIQKVISDYYSNFKYWVTASQKGEILFYRNQHKGKKLIQQLNLPLEDLWEDKKGRRWSEPVTTSEAAQGKLRAPILFPPPTSAKKVFISSDFDLFAVTKERNLLRHHQGEKSPKGWELVLEEILPSASHFAVGPNDNGKRLFLCFKIHNRELTIYRLETGESKSIFFNDWRPSRFADFFFAEQEFYYMNDDHIWSFSWQQDIQVQKNRVVVGHSFINYYEMLRVRAETEKSKISFTWSVLKNIHNVFINQQGNLVFNKHELVLSKAGHIQLLPAAGESRKIAITAKYNSEQSEFTFPGGNKIRIHRSGLIVLQRANDPGLSPHLGAGIEIVSGSFLPSVYIPAVLEASLAAATDTHFAGNLYYYPIEQKHPLVKLSTPGFYEENIRSFIQHVFECS